MIRYSHLETPVGRLGLVMREGQLTRVRFLRELPLDQVASAMDLGPHATACTSLGGVVERIHAYFRGELDALADVACRPKGTAFQQQVWKALRRIPAGQTRSYGTIAADLGKSGASRAVGAANGANPIPLVIPCHRVIGADGRLTGFSSGLDIKGRLLRHEGALSAFGQLNFTL